MRRYESMEDNKLEKVVCNKCGKELRVENGYLKEGCFHVDYVFGYFSSKDGVRHQLDLCEECYDRFVGSLLIPVDTQEEKELL